MKTENRSFKRFLACLMAVVMTLCCLPVAEVTFEAKAEDGEYTEGYYTYEVYDGKATITDCDENISGDVVIPDTLGGYLVTKIGSCAFEDCGSLTSIEIPNSVTSIGDYAFQFCTSLTSVDIPNSVTSIGNWTFEYCYTLASINVSKENQGYSSLNGVLFNKDKTELIRYPAGNGKEKYEIPSSVTIICNGAFEDCDNLTSVVIPNGLTIIGEDAFMRCEITNIMIPNSVTIIGDGAFAHCTNLTDIEISNNVTSISYKTFCGCTNLTSITIPKYVTRIDNCAFDRCTSLTNVDIPNSVTSIGWGAFRFSGLTSITIPDSVTIIEAYAFDGCSDLTSIIIPDSVTSIGNDVFDDTAYYNDESNWDNDVLYIGNRLIEAKRSILGAYNIKEGTKTIEECAFQYCTGLESVTIPDSVTRINADAFSDCTSLTSITFPDCITSIGDRAFSNCTSLVSIIIPDGVISIDCWAFYNTAYYNDESNWENGVLYIGNCLIQAKESIPSGYDIKSGTKVIAESAFSDYCTDLTSITLPDSMASIGSYAFWRCTDLTRVMIPDGVTNIGEKAFGYYYNNSTETYEKLPNFTIHGYTGTAAETYANENGFTFIALGEEHTHTFSDWTVTTSPTCTTEGKETRTCSVCGETETRPLEKIDHDLFHVEEASTCKVQGVSYDVCDSCGNTFNYTVLPLAPHNFSEWVTTKEATIFESGEKERTCSVCGFKETEVIEKIPSTESKDEDTGISVIYPNDSYEGEVEVNVTETFDGTSYHILNTEKGNYQKSLFDITTLINGEKVQPNGSVFVKIPLPVGYNAEKTFVYYVTNEGRLEKMDSRVENGYIIFETTHFSYYAIVDESHEIAPEPSNPSASCKCMCHKTGFMGFIYKIARFFWKLFKTHKTCDCGVAHY